MQDSSLQIKLEKSEFHVHKLKYLGYIISESGVKMDSEKNQYNCGVANTEEYFGSIVLFGIYKLLSPVY